MQKSEYVIEVLEGSKKLLERHIPAGEITEKNLETLVLLMAARYGNLDDDEVVGSLLKRNVRGYLPLLEVNKHAIARRFGWVCGENPHVLVTSKPVE
jgi:hypothetical protein